MDIVIFDSKKNELGIIPSHDFVECITLFGNDVDGATGFRVELHDVNKHVELVSRGVYFCDNEAREYLTKLLAYWTEHDSIFIAGMQTKETK